MKHWNVISVWSWAERVAIQQPPVLHACKTFAGERRMCGGYINKEDWISRLNVLGA